MPTRCAVVFLAAGLAAILPINAHAQRRHGGYGRPIHTRTAVYVGGYYYSPYWAYDPWFWSPFYGPWGPYGYYPAAYGSTTGLRLDVRPKDVEVFVDGYLAGVVDDFDGFAQRLDLPPGEHEITLFREGYRTVSQRLYLRPGSTYKVRHAMVPLGPGEVSGPRPEPPPATAAAPAPAVSVSQAPPPQGPAVAADSRYGELAVRVQPDGAQVLIDGEAWQAPAGVERLVVQLPAGVHRVEVRKDGFDVFTADVTVNPGETTPLNISLRGRE